VRRTGGPWWIAATAGIAFVGTYPQSGAFYDLVRPDMLAIALAGWAVVTALGENRRSAVVAGLLLALAVATKHNLGALAAPIAFALALRDPRDAAAFLGALGVPVIAGTVALQLMSDGAFLTYLLEVPLSHPVRWEKGLNDTVRDWGMALPALLPISALILVTRAAAMDGLPRWLTAGVPVWLGIALGWWLTYIPPTGPAWTSTTGLASWALGAGLCAAALWAADALRRRVQGAAVDWRGILVAGVVCTAAALALWMRAHHGGFVNVHAPLFWAACLGSGVALSQARPWHPALTSAALALQLGWSAWHVPPDRLTPTAADETAGWQVVEHIRATQGPVLSPFASWLPVYAGKAPSIHAMAVWDLNYQDGPYIHELWTIEKALRDGHWDAVLIGPQVFLRDVDNHYRFERDLFQDGDGALMPKTGWFARPEAVWVPRESMW
jgi:hypothetical protein